MKKVKEDNRIFSFFLIVIGILFSIRLVIKFYTFHYIIPVPYSGIPGITINVGMSNTSLVYSLVGFIIGIVLIKKVFKDKKNALKIGLIGLGVGFAINLLFYITNPWYTLQTHPGLFMYQDGKNITNKEIYFYLTERYGFDSTLYKPFKTLEDGIEGLEFAMKIKEPSLYRTVFEDSEKFGYENLIINYNNDSFQLYFLNYVLFTSQFHNGKINNLDRNLNYLNLLLNTSSNNEIVILTNDLKNKLNKASQLDENQMKQIMDDYLKEYLDKIFNTKIDKSNFL